MLEQIKLFGKWAWTVLANKFFDVFMDLLHMRVQVTNLAKWLVTTIIWANVWFLLAVSSNMVEKFIQTWRYFITALFQTVVQPIVPYSRGFDFLKLINTIIIKRWHLTIKINATDVEIPSFNNHNSLWLQNSELLAYVFDKFLTEGILQALEMLLTILVTLW